MRVVEKSGAAAEESAAEPLDAAIVSTTKKRLFRSPLWMLGAAFGLALVMWSFNFQPVNSDTTKLVAVYDATANLLDPSSPVWDAGRKSVNSNEVDAQGKPTGLVSTTIVPLSAQYILAPQGGSILGLQARAAWNGNEMAIRVSWKDESRNVTGPSADNLKTFSDAVAVEFPLEELIPGRTPFRCMGQSEQELRVNIWQWKAERDADLIKNLNLGVEPVRGAPNDKSVKNYVGPGPGYLIDPAQDDPDSKAFYNEQDKTWTVIFKRQLLIGNKTTATQFTTSTPGNLKATQIAFAVWDGGAGERLSKKGVSTWVDLNFEPGDTSQQTVSAVVNLGIVALLTVIVLVAAWRLLPRTNRK